MAPDEPRLMSITSNTLNPEEIARRTFPTVRKGADPDAVRRYLETIAEELRVIAERETQLRRRVAEAERRAAEPPVLDEETLTRAVGAETARILQTAHDAAREVVARAEATAAELVAGAEGQVAERAAVAEAEASRVLHEAQAEAVGIEATAAETAGALREAAQAEADEVAETAHATAGALLSAAKRRSRDMLREARERRRATLTDLTEQRRALYVQLEQLRSGRDHLVEVVEAVAEAVDTVRENLAGAEHEARLAAAEAGERAEETAAEFADELDLEDEAEDFGDDEVDELLEAIAEDFEDADDEGADDEDAYEEGAESEDGDDEDAESEEGDDEEGDSHDEARSEVDDLAGAVGLDEDEAEPESEEDDLGDVEGSEDDGLGPEPEEGAGSDEDDETGAAAVNETDAAAGDETGAAAGDETDAAAGDETGAIADADSPGEAEDGADRAEAGDEGTDAQAGGADPSDGSRGVQAAPRSNVDELFARIRASNDANPAGDPEGGGASASAATAVLVADDLAAEPAEEDEIPGDTSSGTSQAGFAKRDAALRPITTRLSRALKRALQDDQNELLDSLRHASGRPDLDTLLPAEAQRERYSRAASSVLGEAWLAGRPWLRQPADSNVLDETGAHARASEVGRSLAAELAQALVSLLRHRLSDSIGNLAEIGDGAQDAAGAAYREWKGSRIEGTAGDFTTRAFAAGAIAGGEGQIVVWLVDDGGQPCPDCDDNALAGETLAGDVFPTGQLHPPVHPGCRCLLIRSE